MTDEPAAEHHRLCGSAELVEGRRHVFEAEMKELRRTQGRCGHEATPNDADGDGDG